MHHKNCIFSKQHIQKKTTWVVFNLSYFLSVLMWSVNVICWVLNLVRGGWREYDLWGRVNLTGSWNFSSLILFNKGNSWFWKSWMVWRSNMRSQIQFSLSSAWVYARNSFFKFSNLYLFIYSKLKSSLFRVSLVFECMSFSNSNDAE